MSFNKTFVLKISIFLTPFHMHFHGLQNIILRASSQALSVQQLFQEAGLK